VPSDRHRKERAATPPSSPKELPKAPSGIPGLDDITEGGLPRGRPTIVCGSAGCGKTLFAMEFLVRGAVDLGEPGVFMAFEETAPELAQNVRSLGFNVEKLVADGKLFIDHVQIEPSEIEETGDYDLEGLFLRLGSAIDTVGAKRVAIDTLETLFASFANERILRAELRRLFRWLKDRGVTAVITAERGDGTLTRHGLEEYVSDCVILLDHRISDQVATRRLRIVKYRGSSHGTNEYPFLIDDRGIEVMPITSARLDYEASQDRISTGVPSLDEMLGGEGIYRGSTVLVSGTAGTGKTSVAAQMVDAACRRGERCVYFAFEESSRQIVRNMRSIGLDLGAPMRKGLLRFDAVRPTLMGLEAHLTKIYWAVRDFEPTLVVVDPITNLASSGGAALAEGMLARLIDFFKTRQITLLLTCLTRAGERIEGTEVGVSSVIDTWVLLRDIESTGERNRAIYVLKSRGMKHSNQIREFLLTDDGIRLRELYVGPEGFLTGSARLAQQARGETEEKARREAISGRQRAMTRRKEDLEAEITAKRRAFEAETEELRRSIEEAERRADVLASDRDDMALERGSAVRRPGRVRPRARRLKAARRGVES
jgi:circadian clock protein KaiC